MKIIAVYNGSGGEYHRVKLPLSYIKEDITFVETLTEEIVKDANIIYIHWTSPVSIPILSVWQSKYRFKVVADIDDSWDLSNIYNKTIFQSRNLCRFSDAVICTNEYIKRQIVKFNENVTIIPNYLPRDNQFSLQLNFKEDRDKLNIGIGGSISHHQDWLLLKKHIKKIEKDFKDNIQWHLFGIDSSPLWKDIINMMSESTIKYRNTSVENYMQLYENIDVMLCPLANTPLAKGRSALKIYECIHAGVIPIISDLYIKKDESLSKLPVNDWYNNIKNLILNKEYRKNLFQSLNTICSYDYGNDCVLPRLCIFADLISYHSLSDYKHSLYSIKYQEDQLVEYTPYFNKVKTIKERSYLFEYNPIIDIIENSTTNEYIGIFSHRFPQKTGFYKKIVINILDKENADVVNFCRPIKNYLLSTEEDHPGFTKIFTLICNKLNLKIRPNKITTIYSNFFVAKGNIYREYVEVLKKAIEIMENDPEIKKLCWQDANYNNLTKKQLFYYTELPHYTFHTFILERLFSVWLDNNNFSISTYY
jgi:DNA-directed RNA polymerase subunit L